MPPAEPTPTDVAAVAAMLDNQPAPVAPAEPVAQPVAVDEPVAAPVAPPVAPVDSTDPFATLFSQPTEPVAQPTEPVAPQPVEPVAPVVPAPAVQAPVVEAPTETYQSYDDYMKDTLKDVTPAISMPDPDKIDPNNPEAIKGFFDQLVETAVNKSQSEIGRKQAIQSKERQLWDDSFDKYGTLKSNKPLRDMVHDIRMGYFRRGVAITPTQAADKLLQSLGNQYKQGAADSAVVTTIQDVQPTGGGSGTPVTTTLDSDNFYQSLQTGGETALANLLDIEVKAGRL